MSGYTKGEWKEGFREVKGLVWYGVSCGNTLIAHMLQTVGEFNEEEANAKLIAAAPKLYEACKEFVRKCECGEARSVRSYKQMKEAINLVEGKGY